MVYILLNLKAKEKKATKIFFVIVKEYMFNLINYVHMLVSVRGNTVRYTSIGERGKIE